MVMHMRGDPATMARPEHTAYGGGGGVWRGVGAELQRAAERAEAAGVPAWSIILDPGAWCSSGHQTRVTLREPKAFAVASFLGVRVAGVACLR